MGPTFCHRTTTITLSSVQITVSTSYFTFQLPYCSSICCCYCIISHRLLLHVTIAAAVQCRQVLLGCDRLAQHLTNYHQTILQIISVSNTDYLQTLFLSLSFNYTICYMNPYFKKKRETQHHQALKLRVQNHQRRTKE